MSFSEYDVDRRTKKGNFLQQLNVLINWDSLSLEIQKYYSPKSDVIGRPAYAGILLFKMLLVGIWSKGLSDEAVEDMANSNLHVMRFLGIKLEDDVPDHSVLSRFRTALTKANAWNDLLDAVNQQLANLNAKVSDGYHVDASVTISQRQPKGKPTDEVRTDRSEQDDEHHAHQEMSVLAVTNDGLVEGVITTAANTHDSQPFMALVDQCKLPEGSRLCADKGYTSQALWFGGKN